MKRQEIKKRFEQLQSLECLEEKHKELESLLDNEDYEFDRLEIRFKNSKSTSGSKRYKRLKIKQKDLFVGDFIYSIKAIIDQHIFNLKLKLGF